MAEDPIKVDLFDFSGGIDDVTPDTILPPSFATKATNWNFRPGGGLEKRSGSAKLNSSALNSNATFTHLAEWRPADDNLFLIAVAGNDIARMDDVDGTWDDLTGGLTITAGNNNYFTHTVMEDLHIISNGVDVPIKVVAGGTAAVLGGSPPSGRSVIHVNDYLFFGRDATNKRRLQWSNLGDSETYTATDIIDFPTQITALGAISNNLYVFEAFGITRLPIVVSFFSSEFVAKGVGCAGPRALTNIGGTHLMFLSPNGKFYIFDESELVDVSTGRIKNEIAGWNKARLQHVVMEDYKKRQQVWISVSDGASTTHDKILIYDYHKGIANGSWMVFTGINANVLASIIEQRSSGQGDETMLTGDYNGFAFEHDTGTSDDSTAIDTNWESGWLDLGHSDRGKVIGPLAHLIATEEGSHTVDLKFGFDFSSGFGFSESLSLDGGSSKWGSMIWGVDKWGGGTILRIPSLVGGVGNYIKLGIQSNKTDEKLSLFRGVSFQTELVGRQEVSTI